MRPEQVIVRSPPGSSVAGAGVLGPIAVRVAVRAGVVIAAGSDGGGLRLLAGGGLVGQYDGLAGLDVLRAGAAVLQRPDGVGRGSGVEARGRDPGGGRDADRQQRQCHDDPH